MPLKVSTVANMNFGAFRQENCGRRLETYKV